MHPSILYFWGDTEDSVFAVTGWHFSGSDSDIGGDWLSAMLRDVSWVMEILRGDTWPEFEASENSEVEAET